MIHREERICRHHEGLGTFRSHRGEALIDVAYLARRDHLYLELECVPRLPAFLEVPFVAAAVGVPHDRQPGHPGDHVLEQLHDLRDDARRWIEGQARHIPPRPSETAYEPRPNRI